MTKREKDKERRSQQRYSIGSNAFVLLRDRIDGEVIGSLVDISREGLTLSYLNQDQEAAPHAKLDILVPGLQEGGKPYYIRGLSYRMMHQTVDTKKPSFIQIKAKRMGVRFVDLVHEDLEKLEELIHYSVE